MQLLIMSLGWWANLVSSLSESLMINWLKLSLIVENAENNNLVMKQTDKLRIVQVQADCFSQFLLQLIFILNGNPLAQPQISTN